MDTLPINKELARYIKARREEHASGHRKLTEMDLELLNRIEKELDQDKENNE